MQYGMDKNMDSLARVFKLECARIDPVSLQNFHGVPVPRLPHLENRNG